MALPQLPETRDATGLGGTHQLRIPRPSLQQCSRGHRDHSAQYVSGSGELPIEEVEAWAAEQRELSERGEFFFACSQFCFAATKPAS